IGLIVVEKLDNARADVAERESAKPPAVVEQRVADLVTLGALAPPGPVKRGAPTGDVQLHPPRHDLVDM
ncbi:hypothetical protein, partial [Streptomyces sp. NPDC000851]